MFVRYAAALALAKGNVINAAEIAGDRWGRLSGPASWLRAAVSAGSTQPSQAWGDELASFESATSEFFSLVREKSIPGRMSGLRRTPLQVRLILQTGSATASWVQEGKPRPISELKFAADTLEALKISAVTVVSQDLLKVSSAGTEGWLRDALVSALTKTLNETFVDPANGGQTDVRPKSITNGQPSVTATGDWNADLAAMLALFTGDIESAWLIMSGGVAASLAGPLQLGLSVRGGEASGIPVVVDRSVPSGIAILVDASQIAYGEGALKIEASVQGRSILMDTAPSGAATFSLWQANCAALRTEQLLNWQVAKAGAVVTLTGIGA